MRDCLLQMRPNWHSTQFYPAYLFPKKILSKSKLCPRFLPFKSHENPRWCLHGQNMTCNPMAKHLYRPGLCFFNRCSYLPPAIPIPVPTCSHCFPEIFPHHSWILPRWFPHLSQIIPSLAPCAHTVFPAFSHGFPRSFPVLPPVPQFFPVFVPLFSHIFPNMFPWFSQIVLRFDYMSSLEPDSCRLNKNKPIPDCFPGNPKVLPATVYNSVASLAKRSLDSIVILLVPTQAEAAPYWSSQTSDPKICSFWKSNGDTADAVQKVFNL